METDIKILQILLCLTSLHLQPFHSLFGTTTIFPSGLWLEGSVCVALQRKAFIHRLQGLTASHLSKPFLLYRFVSFLQTSLPSPPSSFPLFSLLASQPQGNLCCPQKRHHDPMCRSRTKQITNFPLMCIPNVLCYNTPDTILCVTQ